MAFINIGVSCMSNNSLKVKCRVADKELFTLCVCGPEVRGGECGDSRFRLYFGPVPTVV